MADITASIFFFFNDTATTEIYTLSLHDALPILSFPGGSMDGADDSLLETALREAEEEIDLSRDLVEVVGELDRKSTRLNSSHANISYAVFCLKKKKKISSSVPVRLHGLDAAVAD